jgi:hypothetical protein
MVLAWSPTIRVRHGQLHPIGKKAVSRSVPVTINQLLENMAEVETIRIIEETISGPATGMGKIHNVQNSCGHAFCAICKRPFIKRRFARYSMML